MNKTMTLVLLRHGESIWNEMNLFTGWTDVDLSDTGRHEAAEAGKLLLKNNIDFDICYTSYLKRAIHTLNLVLNEMDRDWLPVIKSWKLNERHYGALQGLNKSETATKYGEAQVHIWRRSFSVRPPLLQPDDKRNPSRQPHYRGIPAEQLPLGESLQDTIARTMPYFQEEIAPQLKAGKRVLIAAHGNSIRALVKEFNHLSDNEIAGVNIPTGVPLLYEFAADFTVLHKEYIGDPADITAKMEKVARQGKAKA